MVETCRADEAGGAGEDEMHSCFQLIEQGAEQERKKEKHEVAAEKLAKHEASADKKLAKHNAKH